MKFPSVRALQALLMAVGTLGPCGFADDKPAVEAAPFRLLFNAYDGDPRKAAPETFSFQFNTIDLRQPSEFLKIGETVSRTKWKLAKFEIKLAPNATTGEQDGVSELTLMNTETRAEVVLILNRVTDTARPVPKK